jgi:subtilase family serine protease
MSLLMRKRFTKFGVLGISMLVFASSTLSTFSADKQITSGNVAGEMTRFRLKPLHRVAGTNRLRLALCLPLRDSEGLTNLLAAIYDPTSPQFHRYLTTAEFTSRFGPTAADYRAVEEFARTNGLTVVERHPNRLVLDVTGNISAVERAFHIHLNVFRHPTEPREFIAPDVEPTVDARVPIFQVSGLDSFYAPHPNVQVISAGRIGGPLGGSSPLGSYIGYDFRNAYVPGTTLTGAGQSVGLVEFDGFHPSDITNYANLMGLSNVPPLVVVPVDGGVATPNQAGAEIEVALDIEMVVAMSPGVSNIYVYEAPFNSSIPIFDARWVDLLSRMANDNLAKQLSCSWFVSGAGAGAAGEQIFQQMAAQGQSFYAASGDSDAWTGAIPFPDQSPSITLVGGTTLTTDNSGNYVSETVWNTGNNHGSGGGVCPSYAIPPWQLGIDMTANHGSTLLRNMPDVALTADNIFVIYGNGTNSNVGGTSCAAPLWAAITALVNQQGAQSGKPPLGFANPAIYALGRGPNYATAFRDITSGNNTNSSSPTNFPAVPGFDLSTGWGTPNGTNLINALATPDNLGILPAILFSASGPVGGPFDRTNWNMTLTNTGATSLNWSLGGAPSWLLVSTNGGTLTPGGTANVSLRLTGEFTLTASNYVAALLITNQTLSRIQTVEVQLSVGQSIVQNGGFESGDFRGWTLVGTANSGTTIYNTVADAGSLSDNVVHSGIYGAFLGDNIIATLSQTLNTLPGHRYVLSFWLANPQTGLGQQFMANWNTNSPATNQIYSLNNPPAFAYTNVSFVLTAAGTNTTLQFGAANPPDGWDLDDVTVTPAPAAAFASFAVNNTNGAQMTWNSLAGLNYQVQYKTNLTQLSWLNLTNIAAASSLTGITDASFPGSGSQRFYRLVLLP